MGAGEFGSGSKVALWIGFAAMFLSTVYFTRASYHSHSKHVLYHFVTSLVCMIAALAYLVMALMSHGFLFAGGDNDVTWVHYVDWLVTTPMLLIDLGMLANMKVAEVTFLSITDALMVCAGYAGTQAMDISASWPYFAFGMLMFAVIVVRLLQKLRQLSIDEPGSAESKCFKFLSIMTLALWACYPLLYILTKNKAMSLDVETIVYTILDILAKCVFGAILVGSREVLEGEHTPLALFAMAATGINPNMRRASSGGVELQSAIAEYMKGNPLWKAAPGGGMSRRGSLDGLVSPGGGMMTAKSLGARGVVSDSSEEADPERAQGRVFSNREAVPSPAGFASPVAAAPASGASALTSILQGLLAQQQATGGRDPAINAQVQAVLAAIAGTSAAAAPAGPAPPSGVPAASGPGSRRASAGPGLLATLMQNAATGPGAVQAPGVVSA